MPLNIDVKFVVGSEEELSKVESCRPLKIFSSEARDFLNELSACLLHDPNAKNFSDVITFAFWCRKASINKMMSRYSQEECRLGRGVVFHIAPSNVAVNFAYSFVAGLLAGNVNIVRLPSKFFPQVDIICAAVKNILVNNSALNPYIYMIRYGHEKEINDFFSARCNVRVIWGGDNTIETIRRSPLKVRATEITFSDRYGIAVIDAEEYLKAPNKARIATDFFNDTYLTDQNACSSPKFIIWFGNETDSARKIFWEELQTTVDKNYELKDVQAVDKLTKLYLLGATGNAKFIRSKDNKITRLEVDKLSAELIDYQSGGGFFIEYRAQDLNEILPLCNERCQTLAHYGVEPRRLKEFILSKAPDGIDRVVEIGKTLDFSLTWDGYDLIRSMSRVIHI